MIGYSVRTNSCHDCNLGPKEHEEVHNEWVESHKALCQRTLHGLANAIEVEAIGVVFRWSKSLRNMQHSMVLCDGDSKAFHHVSKLGLYDKAVVKEDCINHDAKRLFRAIEN